MHLAGGDIREHQCCRSPIIVRKHAGDIVIGILVQHAGFDHGAGGDKADHVALHQSLAQRRVGQLLAYRDLVALIDQLLYVYLTAVVWHAAHRRPSPGGQRKLQFPGHILRVLKEHLVEIPQPEE